MTEKNKKVYRNAILIVAIFLAFIITIITMGYYEIWSLLLFFGMFFISAIIVLILYSIKTRGKDKKETNIKKFKGKMTIGQFEDFIHSNIYLKRGFNYKKDFDIIVGHLGKDIKKVNKDSELKESNEEKISRIPIFKTILEHKYSNETLFILINRIDPEDFVIYKNPSSDKIKEISDEFTYGEKPKPLKLIKEHDPLTGTTKQTITSDADEYINIEDLKGGGQ